DKDFEEQRRFQWRVVELLMRRQTRATPAVAAALCEAWQAADPNAREILEPGLLVLQPEALPHLLDQLRRGGKPAGKAGPRAPVGALRGAGEAGAADPAGGAARVRTRPAVRRRAGGDGARPGRRGSRPGTGPVVEQPAPGDTGRRGSGTRSHRPRGAAGRAAAEGDVEG